MLTYDQALPKVRAWFSRPEAVYGYDGYNSCIYRGDENPASEVRCGIGCLMPDELYRPEMEGTAVGAFFDDDSLPFLDPEYVPSWERLQAAHDRFAEGGFPCSEFVEWLDEEIERRGGHVA